MQANRHVRARRGREVVPGLLLVVVVLALVILAMAGCYDKPYGLTYWRDRQTGICFASSGYPWATNYAMTAVPCQSVEHLSEFQGDK